MNHKKKATLLSGIPGVGQIYNGQWKKGIMFLCLAIAYGFAFADILNIGLWGVVTLGTETPRDNSVFLLGQGILSLVILAFGVVFYYFNLRDAYINGGKIDKGIPLNSIREQYKNLIDQGYPYLISGPALFLLIFAVVFPIIFSLALGFTNYNLYNSPPANLFEWVGLETFIQIFTVDIWRRTFLSVLSWTIIWTLVATTLQVSVGIFLAVLVNQKDVKFKRLWRTILVLPWAVPGFVTILIFAGLFNESFGAINNDILSIFNINTIPWLTNANWTRIALILIQSWLGFPYVFIVTTGVLQSIPNDLYEASIIDGASAWQKFRNITLPMVLITMSPIIITQYTFNFNNFNIIYLFNGGGPALSGTNAGGSDILVSWIYSLTLESNQYALASALTMLLSVFVILIALWQFRKTKSFQEVK